MQSISTLPRIAPAPSALSADVQAWTPILAAYCVYLGIALLGYVFKQDLLSVGGLLFVLIIAIRYGHTLRHLPVTPLSIAVLLVAVLPLIPISMNSAEMNQEGWGYLVKHEAFYLIILISVQLRLPPLTRCPQRVWAYIALLAVLILSPLIARLTGRAIAGERISGLFANPNNLALAALCLCCLIDDTSNRSVRWFTHLLVLLLIVLSGTAGAMEGYLLGRFYQVCQVQRSSRRVLLMLLTIVGVILMVITFRQTLRTNHATKFVTEKIDIAVENIPLILAGRQINYGPIEERNGEGMASGLWRLEHWRRTILLYRAGTPMQQLFGYGIGTSDLLLGKKPHNDYLRMLLEMGLIGALAVAVVWGLLVRRMAPASRWVFVMFAVYALTENNADNFVAVTLLALFVTSVTMSAEHRRGVVQPVAPGMIPSPNEVMR